MKKITRISICVFSFICMWNNLVLAQSSFKLTIDDPDLDLVTGIDIKTNLSIIAPSSESYITANASSSRVKKSGVVIFGINDKEQISKSFKILHPSYGIEIFETELIGTDLFAAGIANALIGQESNLFFCKIDLRANKIAYCHILDSDKNSITDVKLTTANRKFYIAYTILVNMSNKHKIICLDEAGTIERAIKLETSSSYGSVNGICVLPGEQIFACLTYYENDNDFDSEILILKFNQRLELLKTAGLSWVGQAGNKYTRFWDVEMQAGTSNLHLACQGVFGRDGTGPIAITMIDSMLELRTWRNYSGVLIMENFSIGGGKFLLSGQAPVINGKQGYIMVGINNMNAIPEITHQFKEGFLNSSIATSSGINNFGRTGILMAATPNHISSSSFISVAISNSTTTNNCVENFSFMVTKDDMVLNPVDVLKSENINLTHNPNALVLELSTVVPTKEIICNTTDLNEPLKDIKLEAIPNPFQESTTIYFPEKIMGERKFISVFTIDGKLISNFETTDNFVTLMGNQYLSKILLVRLISESGETALVKLVNTD